MKFAVCKKCGRKLTNNISIKKQYGPICERKELQVLYLKRQITIEDILKMKG